VSYWSARTSNRSKGRDQQQWNITVKLEMKPSQSRKKLILFIDRMVALAFVYIGQWLGSEL